MQAIDRFRGDEHGLLVATDVAARGLDIPGVRTVVHYQLPHSAEVNIWMLFTMFVGVLTVSDRRMCFIYLLLGLCSQKW